MSNRQVSYVLKSVKIKVDTFMVHFYCEDDYSLMESYLFGFSNDGGVGFGDSCLGPGLDKSK